MIHEFAVSNYFSIYEEATLDFRIPGTAPDLPRFRPCQDKPVVRLPTVVALMGPNGSGKTTLLRALVDVVRIAWVSNLSTTETPVKTIIPFLLKKAQNEPTRFRVEFDADWLTPGEARELFRYELWGVRRLRLLISSSAKPCSTFQKADLGDSLNAACLGAIYVSPKFGLKPKDPRLEAVRADASVIATLAALNVPLAMWMAESLNRISLSTNILYHGNWQPTTEAVVDFYESRDEMKSWMKRQMQRSDLAIQDVHFSSDNTGKKLVRFKHRGLDADVTLPFESGGTRRLFHLLPQIRLALDTGGPAILDEVDGDLHVDIINEIIHWFHNRETNPHDAQLLISTHNVGVLDDLEKEELFIVEKGQGGATCVHGAQDVSGLRRDIRLYPKYRSGVLGGLPKIG